MGKITTVGKALLELNTPTDLHPFLEQNILDKKNISVLFNKLSSKGPEVYKNSVSTLSRLGFEVATRVGSTVSLQDLLSPIDKKTEFEQMDRDLTKIKQEIHDPVKRKEKIDDYLHAMGDRIDKQLIDVGVGKDQTLAKFIRAGARGSATQYRQTVFSPFVVQDAKGKPMSDFIIRHSFSEGLTLPEYLAATFGARQGEVSKKLSTAKAGYFCFSGDTKVRMADFSEKEIKDIKVGDMVLGSDMFGNLSATKVTATFNNGVRDVNEYIFRKGKSRNKFLTVTATENHIFVGSKKCGKEKQYSGKIQLGDLKPGLGYSALPNSSSNTVYNEKLVDKNKALLLGLLLGDGDISGHNLTFSTSDLLLVKNLNTEILPCLNLVLKKINRVRLSYEYLLTEIEKSPKIRDALGRCLPKRSNKFAVWLDELGVRGTNSYNKFIPLEVRTWDSKSVANLIAGLIETDGCISYTNNSSTPTIQYYSVSEKLATELQFLLQWRFGIFASLNKVKAKLANPNGKSLAKNCKTVPGYSLIINNPQSVHRFFSTITLPGIKQGRLAKFIEAEKINVSYNHDFSYSFISKEDKGKVNVYDIEVDNHDHLYVLANGLIVSNSKQLSRASMTLIIEEHDCGTDNGLEVPIEDKDSIGCFLAHPTKGYNKNNEVTPSMLGDLKNKGVTSIVVRSPVTCVSSRHFHPGAVCQMCVGKRERQGLNHIGEYIGLTAASTLGEPLAQGQLSAKHTSGSVGKKNLASGFSLIDQLANIPKGFKNKAPLSEFDGTVVGIREAPQGGYYVKVKS